MRILDKRADSTEYHAGTRRKCDCFRVQQVSTLEVRQLRETEIENLGMTIFGSEDIFRLEIAMDGFFQAGKPRFEGGVTGICR